MSTGASMNRHGSKQDYGTPWAFIAAVQTKFGPLAHDLAASPENAKCKTYYTESDNSLAKEWHRLSGYLWLNPPFADIAPWAEKCAAEGRYLAQILMLVPASVGSNWFAQYVHGKALVHFIQGRLSFDGKMPYPKDCMLCQYGVMKPGYGVWDWRKESLV